MIVLDEQMRQDQRRILADWHIAFRQIGREVATAGFKDGQIIPFLLTLKRPTFFTHDQGFFKFRLCHPRYSLVWLNVSFGVLSSALMPSGWDSWPACIPAVSTFGNCISDSL